MKSYIPLDDPRVSRAVRLVELYNQRRFDELMQAFSPNFVAIVPERLDATPGTSVTSSREHCCELFQQLSDSFGTVTMTSIFVFGRERDIQIEDDRGNSGSFLVEMDGDGLVERFLFIHRRASPVLAA